MNLIEMKECADEVLRLFLQTMPDVPFGEDDIVFEFVRNADIAKRAIELCQKYCPENKLSDSQLRDLSENVFANALIGREKSAILILIDTKIRKMDFRVIVFHELMHVMCSKAEIDGEHFIDIYGTGTPFDTENTTYNGFVVSGYTIWSEFIAQYYALKMMWKAVYRFSDVAEYVFKLFRDVTITEIINRRGSFSMLCAHWLNCVDAKETLSQLRDPDFFVSDPKTHAAEFKSALYTSLSTLYTQLQKEKPWKINEEFVCTIGTQFAYLTIRNSQLLGTDLEKMFLETQ